MIYLIVGICLAVILLLIAFLPVYYNSVFVYDMFFKKFATYRIGYSIMISNRYIIINRVVIFFVFLILFLIDIALLVYGLAKRGLFADIHKKMLIRRRSKHTLNNKVLDLQDEVAELQKQLAELKQNQKD